MSGDSMPIYGSECRGCGHQFEFLLMASTVPACPACQGQDLQRLLSGFAVSSDGTRQTHLNSARKRFAKSKDHVDKKVAESEEVKEHLQDYLPKRD